MVRTTPQRWARAESVKRNGKSYARVVANDGGGAPRDTILESFGELTEESWARATAYEAGYDAARRLWLDDPQEERKAALIIVFGNILGQKGLNRALAYAISDTR